MAWQRKNNSAVEGEELNKAKKIAAFEITKLVHGEEEAKKAEDAANALFSGSGSMENIPSVQADDNIGILDAIILAGFAPSKGQARTLIDQGGITINDEKVTEQNLILSSNNFEKDIILKKGKKSYCKIILK